ncbi:unnamed protein product [Caenorhabditis brenneri]
MNQILILAALVSGSLARYMMIPTRPIRNMFRAPFHRNLIRLAQEVLFWSKINIVYDGGERRKLVWPRESVIVEIDVKEHCLQLVIENDWYKSYEQRMSMFECKRLTVVSVDGVVNSVTRENQRNLGLKTKNRRQPLWNKSIAI